MNDRSAADPYGLRTKKRSALRLKLGGRLLLCRAVRPLAVGPVRLGR